MQFLANPLNIWQIGQLEHKRTVLKLAFSDRLSYSRKTGFQTPKTSCVFSMLEGLSTGNFEMAEREGFEPQPFLPIAGRAKPAPAMGIYRGFKFAIIQQ